MTMRFPNSTRPWNWRAGVRWPTEHSGQSAQPRPEPVRRTAAPVSTMRAVRTRATTSSRWLREGETVGVRRRDTPGKRTGAAAWSRAGSGRRLRAHVHRVARRSPAGEPEARSTVGAYVALTKPRIIELLLVTTLPTMVVAQRGLPPVWLMVATLAGGALAAGGANAINMVVDRDIDRLMNRTKNRPLVTGAMTPAAALVFALDARGGRLRGAVARREPALGRAGRLGHALLRLRLHPVAQAPLDAEHRDRRGGRRGAGARRLGGGHRPLAWAPVVLFAIIFIWTPPHFWSLAVRYQDDYRRLTCPCSRPWPP